jgi:hypothetical protein
MATLQLAGLCCSLTRVRRLCLLVCAEDMPAAKAAPAKRKADDDEEGEGAWAEGCRPPLLCAAVGRAPDAGSRARCFRRRGGGRGRGGGGGG